MLFDIVGNAVKFTKSGFVEVRATFATTGGDASHGTLSIEVEDTGCGIDEEDLRHIMSPYEQVNAKEARHGGTGLGLALCRQLAKAMGGDISVASTLGKGSTFTITLPGVRSCKESEKLKDESERRSADKTSSSHPTTYNSQLAALNSSNRRILVVDDQKMNLMVLKAMLKKLGYLDVATAADGKQALDALEAPDAPPFDIVLTDMWMPEMDGEGLVKARRASTKLRALPVHVVTADVEMQSRYAEAGFDGILMKPATLELLKSILP
jgi:CheY-like chemotaxis protein